jgi:class 3 adenylate cyclase/TolB-like protein/tetratricopeptide (TPR) repeat protein
MPSSQIERKLAAIMFTDIAGYTALSAKDSTKASELLKTQRDTLKPIVEKHGGSWMKEMGDGLLLTFDSATSAVECSIAIQVATKDIEDLNLRIGIHEGEVIKQDGDVIGDDVNIASRIEPFSAVGGVAISDKIYRAISSNQEFETKYIGKPKLKGVSQEVKVYCITSHGLPQTDISKVSKQLSISKKKVNIITTVSIIMVVTIGLISWYIYPFLTIPENVNRQYEKSIAITYFEYKGDSNESYWSFGLTDELIARLSKIKNIKVSSRLDVDPNRIKSASIFQLKKDLGVDYLLRGRIIKADNQIKISANLVDTGNESIVWSDSYVRKIEDILQLQIELAEDIIDNLSNVMGIDDNYELVHYTKNFNAYKKYLELIADIKNKYIITDEDYNVLFRKIDKILALDGSYVKVLEAKCLFLFIKYVDVYEKMKDEKGDYNVDEKSKLEMSNLASEINEISNKIFQIDNSNRFATLATAGLPVVKSIDSNLPNQLLVFRNAMSYTKKLLIDNPESILANTFIAKLYSIKKEELPFGSDKDLQKIMIYTDKVIEQSKKYIESDNIEFMDLYCIQEAYYTKKYYTEISLEEEEALFHDLYVITKNNRYISGQRNANQELIRVAKKKKDFQKAIELANENLALSKLVNSSRTESWVFLDLHSIYYHDLHNYSVGLDYLGRAMEKYEGIYEFGWRCSYARKLSYAAQYERAKEQIKLVSSNSSSKVDSLKLYYTIGELYYEMEDYQIAAENYERAVSYFTEDYNWLYKQILYSLSNSYYYLGKYDAAISSYQKCFKYSKDQKSWNYDINNRLALIYAEMGKLEDSKQYYSKANELYNAVDNKIFWILYKINQKYNNDELAIAYLDSSYRRLINVSKRYTDESERQIYLNNNKFNKHIREEWEKVK